MIHLGATIIVGSGGIDSVVAPNGNNISSKIPTKKIYTNEKPFILGSSKLGHGYEMRDEVRSYISRQISDENGRLDKPFEMTIYPHDKTKYFSIIFDNEGRIFPKELNATFYDKDGNFLIKKEFTYEDNDPIYTITLITEGTYKCVINFDRLNIGHAPIKIDGVVGGLSFDINKRNAMSIDTSCIDRSDIYLPSYGIISNSGKIKFNDFDGEVLDANDAGVMNENVNVRVFLIDTISKKQEQIGEYKASGWDYDNNNRSATVSIKDDLEEWQDINVDGIPFSSQSTEGTFADIYRHLYDQTPLKYNLQSYDELDEDTKYILDGKIQYPILSSGTLWNGFQKLCEACWLRIYKYNGKTLCKHTKIMGG